MGRSRASDLAAPGPAPEPAAAPPRSAASASGPDEARASRSGPGRARPFAHQVAAAGQSALERLGTFRPTYVAVFVFALLYVFSVQGLEALLARHFQTVAQEAVLVTDLELPVPEQIHRRLAEGVSGSPWVRWGGVRVALHVVAGDGRLLYLNGRPAMPSPEDVDPAGMVAEAERLLPATALVDGVSIPIDSVLSCGLLVLYGGVLLQGLFALNRAAARRQEALLESAQGERDDAARRTESIEAELAQVQQRLLQVEPAEREQADEIRSLEDERRALQAKLADLATREEELRQRAARASELDQERRALEDLLEEAAADLSARDEAIQSLEQSLKKASRRGRPGGRGREGERWARRLRTLYKSVEFDDRAIDDLVDLQEDTLRLKAEEAVKRLAEEAENVAVRRKVGGLPPQLSIFELGFAGKGRIYYTRGRTRRFRVLLIGTKATQKSDLEYLSRLDAP